MQKSQSLLRNDRNCPNCGAPLKGWECEYCGTQFHNFADLDINKPCYARVKLGGRIVIVKFIPLCLDIHNETVGFEGAMRLPDGQLMRTGGMVETTFTLEGSLLPLEG